MRLTIVSQYFHPEQASTAVLLFELARALRDRGVSVRAITGQPSYHGAARAPRHEVVDGVEIRRVPTTQADKNAALGRAANTMSFTASAAARLALEAPDGPLLIVTCPPQGLWLGPLVRRLRGRPYVLLIHDLYPEIAVAVGRLRAGSGTARLWARLNREAFEQAAGVITLGPLMRDLVRERYLPQTAWERVVDIPNWADGELLRPLPRDAAHNPFVAQHGLDGELVVQMSGNLGLFQEIDVALEAARLLRGEGVRFLFIGEGGQKARIAAAAAESDNVTLLDFVPREVLPYSLAAADAALITLKRGVEGLAVPSRLYPVMAAGRPTLAVMAEDADVARQVRAADCGLVVGHDPRALAAAVRTLRDDPARRREMGENARRAFEAQYTLDVVAAEYLRCLHLWCGSN